MDSTYDYNVSTTNLDPATAAGLAGFMIVMWLLFIALAIVTIISMWRLFTKAGKPGWASIVPIYNNIIALEIIGRPMWWIFLFFVPGVNIVVQLFVTLETAKVYGKDMTFGVLMILFPVPMYPILAFGKDTTYLGPLVHEQPVAPTQPTQPQQ